MQPRCIDVYDLGLIAGLDAEDAVTRRLRTARYDADMLSDEPIEQGRLADVGPADERDHAATRSPRFIASRVQAAPKPRALPVVRRPAACCLRHERAAKAPGSGIRRRTSVGAVRPMPRAPDKSGWAAIASVNVPEVASSRP